MKPRNQFCKEVWDLWVCFGTCTAFEHTLMHYSGTGGTPVSSQPVVDAFWMQRDTRWLTIS